MAKSPVWAVDLFANPSMNRDRRCQDTKLACERTLPVSENCGNPHACSCAAKTKTATIALYLISLLLFVPGAQAELKIDFTRAGGPVQAGFQGYFARHEDPGTFTPQTHSAFGTTITITPSWQPGATPSAMQMIDRGGNDGTDTPNLLRDWIGTDNRQPGDPMTLTISGLPVGTYTWTSYHHDTHDQTGLFDVTVNDAAGSAKTTGIDISSTGNDAIVALADVTTFTTEIVSDGSDVALVFDVTSGISPVSVAFFVMNAFVLEAQNPCYNSPPTVQGPDVLVVFVGEPIVINIDVIDDGLPYIEGCNPDEPETGTPYGLEYLWLQQSGPAPVQFEPVSADIEDPNVVFQLAGTYDLLLQVLDGPVGPGQEDGKIAEFPVTVEALRPIDGDIDRTGTVDYLDLSILANQWLDTPACLEDTYCADLDDSGSVTASDFALFSSNWLKNTTKVAINEFVASNRQSLLDGDGKSSDWIELHNSGTEAVSLGGWYLTDEKENLKKWPFPAKTVLPASGYLVVFASEQPTDDYVDAGGHLHTNFAINKGGDYLALVNAGGRVVHEFAPYFPPQQTDISYGMWHTLFRYFAVTTPRKANEKAFLGFTDKTSHSHSRGFYDEAFSLRIFCDTEDAFIRYTLDGSEPTEQHGIIYDPSSPIPIATTTHVRSAAFTPGFQRGDVTSHSYIFPDAVAGQPANPAGWPSDWGYSSDAGAVVPADYEMDPRVVDSTLPGYSVREALLDIPTISISMEPNDFISDATGIYANPQSRWERKCSVEYFFGDNTTGFQHDCKIEIHGNASRRPYRMQKHSFRLTFTSLYGPAKLDYPLFGESGVDEFNQLVLRATFTDSWGLVSWSSSRYRPNDSQYIRDVWMKESLADMGQPSSRGNFVHVYVNGLYFGIHNLTERLADDFFAIRLGGEPEDWEINADFSSPGSRWNTMMSINPATLAGYGQIQDYLDVEDFADYMLLHFYGDSEDWPRHNGYAAANAISGDGKFRFFVWDQEIVLDYHGRAGSRIDRTDGAGAVFQKMRTSEEFRLLFADRVHKACFNGGALSMAVSQARYLEIANWIDKAIVAESARWGDVQMSTPYGNTIQQPSPLDDINHNLYPPAPHGPDYYFTREDSWVVERDNVINNYIPAVHNTANSYALINLLRAEGLYPAIDPAVFYINGTYQHGGYISTGDLLTMTNPNGAGQIYYTLDGSDPRVPGLSQPDSAVTLVAESAAKKVLVPSGAIGADWTGGNEPFNESGWAPGTGGVGYEESSGYEPYISIDVSGMYNSNETCYIRIPFTVDAGDLSQFDYMSLNVRYDDGFIAYINGVMVYKTPNAPSSPTWNSGASDDNPDSAAIFLESFDISSHLSLLEAGGNILAIHGLNYRTISTDFLISAELLAGERGAATGVSENARPYSGPVALQHTKCVKARVLSGSLWSALSEAIYAVDPVAESLRITEIMYHPEDTSDPNDPNEEFIELKNISDKPMNLNLVRFANGIDFTFPSWELGKKNCVLVVKDRVAFDAQYPGLSDLVAGEYTGSLDNVGERIELADAIGRTIQDFKYGDDWRPITDGEGFSLTIIDPFNPDPNSWDEKDSWRASAYIGGSPGADDSGILPNPGAIAINEVMAHSHAEAADWIELYNTTDAEIEIGGWYLSDSDSDLKKYRIADGEKIGAYDYLVLREDVNFGEFSPPTADPGRITGFALSENGDEVYLSSAEGGILMGYREAEDFGASPTGVSFGRYFKTSTGNYNFVLMDHETPGWANAYPKVGPIVISEIMYNPISGDQRQEYIELHNFGSTAVTLYDSNEGEPWKFTDGVDYTFPDYPGLTISAGGYVLIVKDIPAYINEYGVPPSGVMLLGSYGGKLSNAGEKLELSMPGDVDVYGERYYIRADRVNYSDGSHPEDAPEDVDLWPTEPDGGGGSLSRDVMSNYGNDPNNWTAATPSPGGP